MRPPPFLRPPRRELRPPRRVRGCCFGVDDASPVVVLPRAGAAGGVGFHSAAEVLSLDSDAGETGRDMLDAASISWRVYRSTPLTSVTHVT